MNTIDMILPARGSCRWLWQALESVKRQTRVPEYITLVDDGVKEPEQIKRYGRSLFGERFRMLVNSGRGLSDALNTGIAHSTCDWIARMDADDISCPKRLAEQLDFLLSSKDPLLIGCGTQVEFINEKGNPLGISRNPESWDDIQAAFVKRSCFVHPSLMLKRNILVDVPYRRKFDGAEDIDLVLRLAGYGKLLNMPSVLLQYRVHKEQSSIANRVRQTVLQELAIRLYYIRNSGREDPVEAKPGLVEEFVSWRLSQTGYSKTRMLLTLLRYVAMYLKAREYKDAMFLLKQAGKSLDFSFRTLSIIYKVIKNPGKAFVHEKTPFTELNTA